MSININSERFKELLEDRQAWLDANNRKYNKFNIHEPQSELYSDSSHFVFELLQNAEDANAKKAKFHLSSEKIKFTHDGVDFNFDDLNAITSINKSTKVDDHTKIGEHGVGFKSVYHFTESPLIRSGNVEFEIQYGVLPVIKNDSYKGGNTEIILPFNRKGKNSDQDVSNIYNKISDLGLRNILFLNKIQTIEWEFEQDSGVYTKTEQNNYLDQPVSRRTVSYEKNTNSETITSKEIYLVFSEKINIEGKNLQTDIAYGIENNDGEDVIAKVENSKVSVFFETEHETHLNFLIQAMFSTTTTRERIPLNPEDLQNNTLLNHIGDITANSLETIKELNLLNTEVLRMMPLEPDINPIPNMIYEKIKVKLCSGVELLPNTFGSFGNAENSMLSASSWIDELLNKEQSNQLFGKPYFIENCPQLSKLYSYLNLIIGLKIIGSKSFAKSLNKDFFEKQTDDWLLNFYKAIYKVDSLWKKTNINQSPPLLDKFIIRGEDGKHYNIYDEKGDEIIYLFKDGNTHEFPIVKKIFCEDEEDVLDLFEKLGVKEFDTLSYIKKYIFPSYGKKNLKSSNPKFRTHIKTNIDYYEKINNDENVSKQKVQNFIRLVRERMHFPADFNRKGKDNNQNWSPYKLLYFPNDRLREYFDDSETAIGFVKTNDIDEISGYKDFLSKLGVQSLLRPILHQLNDSTKRQLVYNRYNVSITYYVDKEVDKDWSFKDLDIALEQMTPKKSTLLWDSVVNLHENNLVHNNKNYFKGGFYFYNRSTKYLPHESYLIDTLKENAWLYIKGKCCLPSEILYEDLNEEIYKKNQFSYDLIDLLNFKKNELFPQEMLNNLSEEERKDYDQFRELKSLLSPSELASFLAEKKQEKRNSVEEILKNTIDEINLEVIDNFREDEEQLTSDPTQKPDTGSSNEYSVGDKLEHKKFGMGEVIDSIGEGENHRIDVKFKDSTETLVSKFADLKKISSPNVSSNISNTIVQSSFSTEENLQRSIKTDRTQIANIHNLLEKKLNLQTLLDYKDKLDKYSFAWFKVLLSIEYESAKQNMNDKQSLKIFFSKVISLNEKIILLKNPSKNIPSFIEDLPSVNLIIKNNKKRESVKVDVVSLRDNTIKLKLITPIQTISINESTTAEMDVNDPFFLIKELMKEFYNLEIDQDYNCKNDVEKNIKFIFGPPGTGKTTKIANQINGAKQRDKKNILILAPTNKAADVLCRKIISTADSDYPNWLIRFGNTAIIDDEINSIVKDREYNVEDLESFVVISTIARLPYDGFLNIKLNEIEWDEVYFDEASMIHLSYAAYAMNVLKTEKLYFAGDPCQITPIMQYQDWEKENIYEMFELNDFENPVTKPKNFPVKTLNTQYRSIKDIGDLFSHYAYSGQVDSRKKISERNPLRFTKENLKAFTLIRFSVSKYERLMNPFRLGYSPFHIYSSIYSIEIAKFISTKINEQWPHKNDNKEIDDELDLESLNKSKWTIGIICPYKAQSSIVERLIPEREGDDKFIILSGTVHSFQGDECDIVISLFNPPPSISPFISLNNKNIMNVSISRSKQYQILIIPDESIRFYKDLNEIINIVNIIKEKYPNGYNEYTSNQMEEIIFGEKNYIRTNSMVTKHQKINRYNEADYRWEVRCDEEAVDIHIS